MSYANNKLSDKALIAQYNRRVLNRRISLWSLRILLIISILLFWEIASGTLINSFWVSKPSLVIPELWQQLVSGTLYFHLKYTLQEMTLGLAVGGFLGAAAGLFLGRYLFLAELLTPVITAIYSLPKVALAPLFIMWFGIDLASKVALVAVIVFFLVFYNTFTGVREVDRGLINVLRVAGANSREIFWHVILPSAAVWIFVGFRLAVPYALIGAIIAELMASSRGVGYQLQYAAQMFNTTGVFAALVVLMVVSLTLTTILGYIESRILRWKARSGRLDTLI